MVSVGIVLITFNRSKLLSKALDSLLVQSFPGRKKIYVIDNASTDDTAQIVASKHSPLICYLHSRTNLGGAGGFRWGMQQAYQDGFDWVWMLDDDVVAAPNCLERLLQYKDKKVLVPARSNKEGQLVEFSALKYDLTNPFYIKPKRLQVCDIYSQRNDLPELLEIVNFSFEGVLIHRFVIEKVGFPFAEYFISADDTDYAQRIRLKGFPIYLVREAVVVRQLAFNQTKALLSWKGYYMYRNMLILHFLYGTNLAVRLKPYFLILGAFLTGKFKKNPNLSFSLFCDARRLAYRLKRRFN
ncbi:MAG: glycosyltransferase family 2 protein [Neisseriaceae bacterium]